MRIGVPAIILVMLATFASPALSQPYAPRDAMRDRVRSGEIRPLDRIIPDVRRSHPGTFYDAEGPVPAPDGTYRYRLKWMTPDGRILWLDTDARTGRVLGVEGVRRRGPDSDARNYFQDRYGARHSMEGGPLDSRSGETYRSRNQRGYGSGGDRGWRRDNYWNRDRRDRRDR